MTDNQKLKMELLGMFKDVKAAKEAYQFMQDSESQPQASADSPISGKLLKDGVYYLTTDGMTVPYQSALTAPDDTKGILCVQGERNIVVALQDCNDGEDTTLTTWKDPANLKGNYIGTCIDAVADWNGEANTNHLKAVGLSDNISLEDGQYVPSTGEMLFIFTHKKDINIALEKAGGQPIADDWYWTSTEYSATNAWSLYLNIGYIGSYPKAASTIRARPVSAFIS